MITEKDDMINGILIFIVLPIIVYLSIDFIKFILTVKKKNNKLRHWKKLREDYIKWKHRVGGHRIVPIGKVPIVLKDNEVAYYKCNSTLFEIRTAWSHSSIGGISHVGGGFSVQYSEGQSKSHDEWNCISDGMLVITNERIVFRGAKASRIFSLKSIVGLDMSNPEELSFNTDSHQSAMVYVVDNAYILEHIVRRVMKDLRVSQQLMNIT